MAKINLAKFNEAVQIWGRSTALAIQAEGRAMGVSHRDGSPSSGDSLQRIRDNYTFQNSTIDRVGFKFPRNLIWTQKGAGKGRGGSKGSRWIDKYGNVRQTNPRSFGKMGTGGRVAKPFFNNVLDSDAGVNELATIAAEELGSSVIANILI